MVAGGTKRTAAASFMEMLQLKTWGLVDLQQHSTFGDITILPTVSRDRPDLIMCSVCT